MERRLSFGSVAQLYDRARPGYPEQLVEDVIAYAGLAAGEPALEVGAGTGKATALFAARGLALHAVEPDPEMAALLRRRVPGAVVVQDDFEHFEAPQRYRLLYAAQSWHWVRPEVRSAKAGAIVEPAGALAAFWNHPDWTRIALREELIAAYARAAPDFPAAPGPMHPRTEIPELWGDWDGEILGAKAFAALEHRHYPWTRTYTTEEYVTLLHTHSDHMLLPSGRQSDLFAAIAGVLDRHGGEITIAYETLLCLARAAGTRDGAGS